MSDVRIVPLGDADAQILDRIADDVFDNAIDRIQTDVFLAADNHKMMVAVADDLVVGMGSAVVMRHPDKQPQLFVNEVGVGTAWRRRGIGRDIMNALLDWGKKMGCKEAWLGTEIENLPARRLYRGLEPDEEEPFVLYTFKLD